MPHFPFLSFGSCFSLSDAEPSPYMWPYCTQPLYHSAFPIIVNTTILNGIDVTGVFAEEPQWIPDLDHNGQLLHVDFTYSRALWPWSGYLALHIKVNAEGYNFNGIAKGVVRAVILSRNRRVTLELPVKASIVPIPPRNRRLLWDQFHNLRYPSGYFPRDSLKLKNSPLDWHGDHIHTNYREFYTYLRGLGYFVEVLGQPFTCFDANLYGTLIIADSEEEFFEEEVQKLQSDVRELGLSVIVAADWYNTGVMEKIRFFDENTRQWWSPQTGGANVPALNNLLSDFGIQFTDKVYSGSVRMRSSTEARFTYNSGTSIGKFPEEGYVVRAPLKDEVLLELSGVTLVTRDVPIMGFLQLPGSQGRIVAFGDSSCFDSVFLKEEDCYWLTKIFLDFASERLEDGLYLDVRSKFTPADHQPLPPFHRSSTFALHSKVHGKTLPFCRASHEQPGDHNQTDDHLVPDDADSFFSGSRSGPHFSFTGPRPGEPTFFFPHARGRGEEEKTRGLLDNMWPLTYILLLLAFVVLTVVISRQRSKKSFKLPNV